MGTLSKASRTCDPNHFTKPLMLMNVPPVLEAKKSTFTSKEDIFPRKPPTEQRTTLHKA